MKQFDLEEWKKGKKILTRDGHSVRIIATDRLDKRFGGNIIGLVKGRENVYERIIQYHLDGKQINGASELDLIITDE